MAISEREDVMLSRPPLIVGDGPLETFADGSRAAPQLQQTGHS